MSAPPTIPQRPARSTNQPAQATSATSSLEAPQVPPRPARIDRSKSPSRYEYTRSPLNELPISKPPPNGLEYERNTLEKRPSVAALPSIGQEGDEYASMEQSSGQAQSPTHTRAVAGDLPLHAPTAGLTNTHQSSVSNLTRTDSNDAAAAGLGQNNMLAPPSKPASIGGLSPRPTPRSGSRPESMYESDHDHHHGIPHLGPYVPMYPDAGDVQAPSPAPFSPQPTGVGYFNDASSGRTSAHGRRRSQHMHLPPGSYGLHGHGVPHHDRFEQDWYQKHPEERAKEEQGAYGPINTPRGEYSMSSDDLNKLVRDSGSRGAGFGTAPSSIPIPPDSIGYMASQEYAARIASPRVAPLHHTRTPSDSHAHAESPLRNASFPTEISGDQDVESDVIHIDPPERRHDKIHGGGYDPPTEDLGPQGGNTAQLGGWVTEEGRGTPILASDELARNPGAQYMQPAIEPEQEKLGDGEYMAGMDSHNNPAYQSGLRSRSQSRPRSRPTSFHDGHSGHGLTRWASHGIEGTGTPLEDVEEYEPLFADDEEEKGGKPLTAADRFKRPQLETHRFPSQDIWEDTPESLQLQSVATHEQEPEDKDSPVTARAASAFETPEQEAMRKGEITEKERLSYLTDPSKGFAKPKFSAGVKDEMTRPGLQHRFPSQDIWEDTPDSMLFEATVGSADDVPSAEVRSPTTGQSVPAQNDLAQSFGAIDPALAAPFEKPQVPARPQAADDIAVQTQAQPSVPPRPAKKIDQIVPEQVPDLPAQTKDISPTQRQPPSLPDRPKPHVPARPAKTQVQDPASTVEAIKEVGATKDATDVPVVPKQKPSVPSKIGSLKANFMDQLNNRLALGPQAPPKPQPAPEEEQEEKAPLTDARRGRAKGPQRRAAAKVAEPEATTSAARSSPLKFSMSAPMHHWSIDPAAPHDVKIGQLGSTTAHPAEPSTTASSIPGAFPESSAAPTGLSAPDVEKQTMAAVAPTLEPETLESKNDEVRATQSLLHSHEQTEAEGEKPGMVSQAVQTGRVDIESMGEKLTTYDGGAAHPAGSVVVRDGEEERID